MSKGLEKHLHISQGGAAKANCESHVFTDSSGDKKGSFGEWPEPPPPQEPWDDASTTDTAQLLMGEPDVAANSGQQKPQCRDFCEEPRQSGRPTSWTWVTHGSPPACVGDRKSIYTEQRPSQPSLKELFVSQGPMEQLTVSWGEEITQWMLKCGLVEKLSLE